MAPRAPWLMMIAISVAAVCAQGASDSTIKLYGNSAFRAPYKGMVGHPPPELEAERWVSGEPVTLAELKGQVVLLDFWGVWCGPCIAAGDELVQLHEDYADRGLTIIGVHTQRQKEGADAYIEKKQVPYRCMIDSDDLTQKAFHVRAYPTFTFIDARGNLRFIDIDWGRKEVRENLENAVRLLIEEREAGLANTGEEDDG